MALLSHSFQIKAFLNLLFLHFIHKCNKKNRLHILGNHFTHTIQEAKIMALLSQSFQIEAFQILSFIHSFFHRWELNVPPVDISVLYKIFCQHLLWKSYRFLNTAINVYVSTITNLDNRHKNSPLKLFTLSWHVFKNLVSNIRFAVYGKGISHFVRSTVKWH